MGNLFNHMHLCASICIKNNVPPPLTPAPAAVSVMRLPRPHVFYSDNLSIHEVTLLQAASCSAVNTDGELPSGIRLWNMRNRGGGAEGTEGEGSGRADEKKELIGRA